MVNIREWIMKAEDDELTQIVTLLMERQKILHPDWEAMFLSFPLKHREECEEILLSTWKILNELWKKEP